MKRHNILIIATFILVSFSSCSVYKNSPTPDDVYYAPGAAPVETTLVQPGNGNSEYYNTTNENYVKMRVQNPDKWGYFDDYNYDYYGGGMSPYASGITMGIGFGSGFCNPYYGGFGYYSPMSYYNSYYAWNNFYNPYYGGVIIVNGKNNTTPAYTRMSNFNPTAYRGNYYNARPNTNFYNGTNSARHSQTYYNNTNSNLNRSSNGRPAYQNTYQNSNNSQMRSAPSNFGGSGGGGGAIRGGGFSRPGR